MKYEIKVKLSCTIDENHPDIRYVDDWSPDKVFDFEDTYYFDIETWPLKEAREYAQHDLALVAGGGYNTKHIHNVKVSFT